MNKKLNKNSIFLGAIGIISLASAIVINISFGFTVLFVLLFAYILISNAYLINVYKGAKAYKLDDYTAALDCYRNAVTSSWCNSNTIRDYLICELKYGKASIAKEFTDEIFSKRTFKPVELLNLKITEAIVLWKNNHKQTAINLLKSLLEDNKTTFLYETLTSLLVVDGNITEGKNIIIEGLEHNEDSNILKSNLGEVNFKEGNYDEAYAIFSKLIDENIKFVEPFYYLALIEMNNENFDKSKELLEKAQLLNESLVTLVTLDEIEKAYSKVIFKALNA